MSDQFINGNAEQDNWLDEVAQWRADNFGGSEDAKGFGLGNTIGGMSHGGVPGHGTPGHHVPGDGDGDGIPYEKEAELAKRAAQGARRFASRTTGELEDRARKHRKIIANAERMKKNRTARMQDLYDLDESKKKLKHIEEELKHRRNEADITRSAHVGKAMPDDGFEQDDWLENVAMWYAANFDSDLDEKGFARSIGRALSPRGIGGHAPRVGRGSHDIDPLGGRDLEDVIDRNNDGWVFSGRWRRRAHTPTVGGDETLMPKKPGRALSKLPSVRRRDPLRKPVNKPKVIDTSRTIKPARQAGLEKVSLRHRSVLGSVMARFDREGKDYPGTHGDRHVAMLKRVDAAPTRKAAKQVITDRIDEIDTRIDVLNKKLENRRLSRGARSRHLDETMSLLKEREWALHRQQQLADLPDERPKAVVLVGDLGHDRRIPVRADKLKQLRSRRADIIASVQEALDSERPDRANARYLAKTRSRYDGDFGSKERLASIKDELDKAKEELKRSQDLWTMEPDSEQDGMRAMTHAERIRMVESIERDLANAQRVYENRQIRKMATGSTPKKFDPIDLSYQEHYSVPDDLQGLDIEDVYRQELASHFTIPYRENYFVISPLETDRLDARIDALTSEQLKLEKELREAGMDGNRRYTYEQVLKELDFRRSQRTQGIADRMRYEGAIDDALTKDKEGSPISDVESLIGSAGVIEEVSFNQRDVDDWDEVTLSTPEQVRPEAKRLEGKVVSFEEGRPRTGIVTNVDPFDEESEIDSWNEEDLEVGGGSITIWVTHEYGKKLDKPYPFELFGEDTSDNATQLADIVKTFRIHGDAA